MTDNNTTEVYLVCGSGGVGKTTTSAALGLEFAKQGKKVIVLTIDPAKRLATSLGLTELTDTPKKISLSAIERKNKGEMWAMMLDTKRTFDRIVEKYAPDNKTRNKIFGNKIYQHLSQMLAGSQEYMAMERLYEIWQEKKYQVIIVDTPPMQNAKDFLEAPDKLSKMISNSMLHLLLKPSMAIGKTGFKLFEKGSQQILKIMDRVVGFAFLQDISEMLIAFQDLLAGFQSRAENVKKLLQNDHTHFLSVCTTQLHSVQETKDFASLLKTYNYHLKKTIINRIYPSQTLKPAQITKDIEKLKKQISASDAEILIENYKNHLKFIRRDKKRIQDVENSVGKDHTATIPLFLSDIHDLKGLAQIATHLAKIKDNC